MFVATVTHHALSYHEYEDDKHAKSRLVGDGEPERSDLISFDHSPLRFGLADSLWISYHTGGLSCKHRNC